MSWRERAACRGMDPGLFFPERGESVHEAKQVCAGCEVRDDARGLCRSCYRRGLREGMPVGRRGARAVPRPLPLDPVLGWARRQGWSQNELAYQLRPGVDRAAARRWLERRRLSGLSVWEADQIAVSFGVHPVEWWPEFFEVAA